MTPQLRWIDKTQPQTLMMATIIMYINAAFGLIDGMVLAVPIGTVLVLGQVAAGLGVANDKKWGWWLGVALVAFFLALMVVTFQFVYIVNILFYGALLALLLHPQSRNYRRLWFR
ncbi:MAG TPA: hypothetical protein VKU88_02700 [Acidimicrobiales bacterium]|nr:hypothetical protein [Acidimicrobiales bacterium]